MKFEHLKKRLARNRPMTTVSIAFPVDVIEDLKRVAPLQGFSGYPPLVRRLSRPEASDRSGTLGE
jgi:hypothetical protein